MGAVDSGGGHCERERLAMLIADGGLGRLISGVPGVAPADTFDLDCASPETVVP